jgi:uncharacterized membrane protein YdjX (TVP38/TMEM64 family)
MPEPSSAQKRPISLVKLALALVALAVLGLLALRGLHPLAQIGRGVAWISGFGPWAFFGAMAILPGVGVPSSFFILTAGTAFGPKLGMGGVIAAGIAATSVNIALTYWVARSFLRGGLEAILRRFGYKLPEVEGGDMTDLIVLLRVTPGFPLCVQNYLLGLAGVPAGLYFGLSYLFSWPSTAAFLWFGDALLHGRGKMIVLSLTLIIALTAVTHLLRRHLAARKAAA